MPTSQVFLSVAAGKALIAKGLASREDVQRAVKEGTVIVTMGSTNSYLAKELLAMIGIDDFDQRGFFRGILKPADAKLSVEPQKCDVVISHGKLLEGKDVNYASELGPKDMMFKGANAVHLESRKVGVLIGNPTSGTMAPLMAANIGRRVPLIHPVGVEKRVTDTIDVLAELCNQPEDKGLRLYPSSGLAYTELDAMYDLFGVAPTILSAGGIGGYEGGTYFLLQCNDPEALEECRQFCASLADTEPYRL